RRGGEVVLAARDAPRLVLEAVAGDANGLERDVLLAADDHEAPRRRVGGRGDGRAEAARDAADGDDREQARPRAERARGVVAPGAVDEVHRSRRGGRRRQRPPRVLVDLETEFELLVA